MTFQNKSFCLTEIKQCDGSKLESSNFEGKKSIMPKKKALERVFSFFCFNWDKRMFFSGRQLNRSQNKHSSVHLSFTGGMGLKNTFCVKSGQSSIERYACLESLFHTIRAPNTHLHLWLIPGCCSTPWKASSAAKCFNPDLLFSADSCQLRYIIWSRSAEKEILILFSF